MTGQKQNYFKSVPVIKDIKNFSLSSPINTLDEKSCHHIKEFVCKSDGKITDIKRQIMNCDNYFERFEVDLQFRPLLKNGKGIKPT